MFGFGKWEEIYFSANMEELSKKRMILEENGIQYKLKFDNGSHNSGRDLLSSSMIDRNIMPDFCRILVPKEDAERAVFLIRHTGRD